MTDLSNAEIKAIADALAMYLGLSTLTLPPAVVQLTSTDSKWLRRDILPQRSMAAGLELGHEFTQTGILLSLRDFSGDRLASTLWRWPAERRICPVCGIAGLSGQPCPVGSHGVLQ